MKPGDIVQVVPADISDPEAVRLQGKYFRVIKIEGLPLGLGMIEVIRHDDLRQRYVFRERDLCVDASYSIKLDEFDDLPF